MTTATPIEVRPLDPSTIWTRHVQNRSVVYLDTNVWAKLTDVRTPDAVDCLDICRQEVSVGRAVFPLSFASISELLQQPPGGPRELQAALMDELSLGITFRSPDVIQDAEARAAFSFLANEPHKPVPPSSVFTYVVDYLADGAISFPEGWSQSQIQEFLEYWNATPDIRSVTWLFNHLDLEALRSRHERSTKEFVDLLTARIKTASDHFRNTRQFSSARIRHEERLALFGSVVLPAFNRIMLESCTIHELPRKTASLCAEFSRQNGKGGPAMLARLFALMPATELYAQLTASGTLNPTRAVRPQDFWDVEHARVAAAYSDVFVSSDKGLINLLNVRSNVPKARGCCLVANLSELSELLKQNGSPSSAESSV